MRNDMVIFFKDMIMARLGYCDISNLKITPKSKRAIEDIKDIMESGNLLSGALAATPFYTIFGTPSMTKSAFDTLASIREHDWEQFGKTMNAVPSIVRNRIHLIAEPMSWYTQGDERKFWECVSNASL